MTRYLDGLAYTRASGSDFVWLGADRNGTPGAVFIAVGLLSDTEESSGSSRRYCVICTRVCVYI
jgi:hypothetical protein